MKELPELGGQIKKKRNESNISDTAVFSGKKGGVSMETEYFCLQVLFVIYLWIHSNLLAK